MTESKDRKPAEYRHFEKLTERLLSVPKSELDKKVQRYEEKKARRKRKDIR